MKLGLIRTTIALALCTLLGGAALANVKSKNVRLDDEVSVAGTVLKKGTYKVSFDDQTNELTIKRNGKLVVKTNAQLEEHKNTGSVAPDYKTRAGDAGSAAMLTSINLGGAYAVIGNSGGAATAGAQQ
jgi:hypothetical protein